MSIPWRAGHCGCRRLIVQRPGGTGFVRGRTLAAQQARVNEIERLLAGSDTKQADSASHQPSRKIIEEYQALFGRVAQLHQVETELLAKYTSLNRIVKVRQAQIEDLEKQRKEMEEKYPGLIATVAGGASSQNQRPDLVTERARLVEIPTKTEKDAQVSAQRPQGTSANACGVWTANCWPRV